MYVYICVAVPGRNEHYSVSMKIMFIASVCTLGHCRRSSRLLVPFRTCETSYGLQNTAHFGIAAYCNIATSAKISRKDQGKEQFACLDGYFSIFCAHVEQRVKAKGP